MTEGELLSLRQRWEARETRETIPILHRQWARMSPETADVLHLLGEIDRLQAEIKRLKAAGGER